ncbi:substrate-binding periplasmic protein [Colwellia echini]|uniref:Transporter substrate-binding domain-containing protein n=1 Tax=Colwellia echini TaxID=1982103 RepID=A0ABY3N064_9GAMM|nr:transporter substrate-binding domain-containing protein [Colwellia echini]TYK66868.1 transporter substrate-binding domain-containing protein [Colwellia echini]
MKIIIYMAAVLFITNAVANERPDFELATYNAPPYQFIENKVIKGITVSTVQCIFHKLNKKISIDFYPLKRSLRELARNNISGVFPISPDDKTYMNTSTPISIEKWYWLTNFPLADQNNAKGFNKKLIGAVNGSPAHNWLLKNKFSVAVSVTTREQLLNMFIAGRVDAIIIDDNEANRDIEFHQMIRSVEHNWQFIKFESHHFAFSDEVLNENINIVEQFNENIPSCNPLSLRLSHNEQQLLINYLTPYLEKLSHYLNATAHPTKLSDVFSAQELTTLDKLWQTQAKQQDGSLYNFITTSQLSVFLSQLQNDSKGAVTEIIAIDNGGYTIGLSKDTTDLFQGDEPQFLNTFPGGAGTFYISDIKYDASTQVFQSQVSFALAYQTADADKTVNKDSKNERRDNSLSNNDLSVAVVTFGVNVEKVIQASNNNSMLAIKQ